MMDDLTSRVARQYRAYVYPTPIDDIADYLRTLQYLQGDPSIYAPLIWPEGLPRRDLRILSAGCGTNQAAILAYTNPACSVLGIDLSEASLAHEQFLKDKHGLANLRLEQRDLRDVATMGGEFDYIMCTGVLHHMRDPDEGLRALAAGLSRDGVLMAMLYGAHARHGIYLLQDVFRRLGIRQGDEGIAFIQAVLDELPNQHFVRTVIPQGMQFAPSSIVDTFLHEQDVAYTVDQTLAFVRRNGLVFQGWIDNNRYSLENLPADSRLRSAAKNLTTEAQWAIVEQIALKAARHSFLACRSERDAEKYRISFEGVRWLDDYPVRFPVLVAETSTLGTDKAKFVRNPPGFEVDQFTAVLLQAANGDRTFAAILNAPEFAEWRYDARVANARRAASHLWDTGNMFFSRIPVKLRRPGA